MSSWRETPRFRRLWRLRKLYRHIDAEVVPAGNGIELRLLYDDRVIYGRRWDTLELAEADGRARLADLERAGWAAHW